MKHPPSFSAASLAVFLLSLPLRGLARLSQTTRLRLGCVMGRLAGKLVGKRRAIMLANLIRAFPERDTTWRQQILTRHFERLGEDGLEAIWGWYGDTRQSPSCVVIGAEHVERARANGQGVILNTGHFTDGEVGVYLASRQWPIHAVYRPNDNPIIDELINQGRRQHVVSLINRENTRAMVRVLKQGGILWTAADQSYHGKQSAFIPFFGTPCATNIAIPILALMGHAVVLPYFVRRTGGHYQIIIQPPLAGLPSGDDAADTAQL
ncbi:MAG: lysophospholipid acyltransferase family protein, partial [Halothiobacillus sp.]|nr:lysophospholipid acyltransferase family protein [Halothiobacillus sp.]